MFHTSVLRELLSTLEIADNETITQDFTLEPSATELAEIIISGYSSGIVKGLNQQKSDLNVTNVISSDQVGKFPDANVGDVLKEFLGFPCREIKGKHEIL